MQEFLDFVIRHLVDYPDEVILSRQQAGKKTVFHLRVRQTDVGKVIGKHGHTIIAIRNILAAGAARHGEKALLEIIEENGSRS